VSIVGAECYDRLREVLSIVPLFSYTDIQTYTSR
jgi:hypothetical protein